MSELRIDPDLAATLDCEVGDELSITVKGTVVAKDQAGGKVLQVSEVMEYDHEDGEEMEGVAEGKPTMPMAGKKPYPATGKSAVMMMVGK
jgi:hypothetical protein